MALLLKATFLASALLAARTFAQTCESYGVDYQNGGSYFVNESSTADFSFVSIFEGCQNDTAYNILVDPNGDEYECSNTELEPSDVSMLSTCPLQEDDMYSGDWSVLIISNNGDGDPIAYERDFSLSVGIPVTTTVTPTLTLTATSTPLYNLTITTTDTVTNTATTTKTVASVTVSPTVTVTPARVTSTKIFTHTITRIGYSVVASVSTKTVTESCVIPRKQSSADPTATITPTIITAAALSTDAAKARFRRVPNAGILIDRDERIAERKAGLARIKKRAPDSATTTVTDTNTADWATSTTVVYASTTTVTMTTETLVTDTVTSTQTVMSGTTTLAVVTVTAATPTVTKTIYTLSATTPYTVTRTQKVVITSSYIPSASIVACSAKGGSWK